MVLLNTVSDRMGTTRDHHRTTMISYTAVNKYEKFGS